MPFGSDPRTGLGGTPRHLRDMDWPRSHRIRWLPPIFLVSVGLLAAPTSDPLDAGEKAASEWIKTRLETSRIESAWTAEKPLLEATVNGMKERAQALEDKRDDLKAKTAKDRAESESLKAKNTAASEDLKEAQTRLEALTQGLLVLRPSLPPRLSEALELPFRSLEKPGLAPGERMQITTTILERCAQFNRTVTSAEEVLSIEGGTGLRSFDVIYWGLGHGYALDRKAGKAWYGSPGPNGWQWEPLADAARPTAALMAIYEDRADPDFVPVPARLSQVLVDGAVK
jgi:hypothetical protein